MALRKPVSRCNNSSPRYTRENHYAILARMKVSQVFTYKISITLLIFPKCRGEVIAFLTANLAKIFENEGVIARENEGKIQVIFCGMEKIGYLYTEIFEKFRC